MPLGFVPARHRRRARPSSRRGRPCWSRADPQAVDDLPRLRGGLPLARLERAAADRGPAELAAGRARRPDRAHGRRADRATTPRSRSRRRRPRSARAQDRAASARRRVALVGAGAAALLAAFALLAAGALRRDLAAERDRLERRGARRWQLARADRGGGRLAGAGGRGGGRGARARGHGAAGARRPGSTPARCSGTRCCTGRAALALAGCWALATALLVLGSRRWGPRDRPPGGRRGARRGGRAGHGAGARRGRRGRRRRRPAARPCSSRWPAWPPGWSSPGWPRPCCAGWRRRRAAGRSACVSPRSAWRARPPARRSRWRWWRSAARLACFAAAYGATLHHGDRDQAAYRVPLDVTVRPERGVRHAARPRPAGSLARAGRRRPGAARAAHVGRGARAARPSVTLPLLALPAAGLAALRGLARRRRLGAARRARAAAGRRRAGRSRCAGRVVPRGARTLRRAGRDRRRRARPDRPPARPPTARRSTSASGRREPRTRTLRRGAPGRGRGPPPRGRSRPSRARAARRPPATRGPRARARPTSCRGTPATWTSLTLGGRRVDLAGWIGRGPVGVPPRTRGGTTSAPTRSTPPGRALLRPRQPLDGRDDPGPRRPGDRRRGGRGGAAAARRGGVGAARARRRRAWTGSPPWARTPTGARRRRGDAARRPVRRRPGHRPARRAVAGGRRPGAPEARLLPALRRAAAVRAAVDLAPRARGQPAPRPARRASWPARWRRRGRRGAGAGGGRVGC